MNPSIANQPIYQADPAMMQSIHQCRERVHGVCSHYMHKPVRVQMHSGEIYEGTLAGYDDHHVYLQMSQGTGTRFYPSPYYPGPYVTPYNPYYSTVLPLVLYSLLAISLI